MINEIIQEAFIDTAQMVPFLFVIYGSIELFEYKFGNSIIEKVRKAGAYGPLVGALAGIFPQCGFSVIATALFTQKLVTMGTLLAVYLSTSDEALPIILSRPDKIGVVAPLIFTKLIIALIAGYVIDFALRKNNKKIFLHAAAYLHGKDKESHHHENVIEEKACCGHNTSAVSKKFAPTQIIFHPVIHTLKIFIFIFAATLAINFLTEQIGTTMIATLFSGNTVFGAFLAALIGLIPNCAASVIITEFYLDNLITYGTAIAGLSASAGLGILVLLKEEKNKKIAMTVIGLLLAISVVSGTLIQILQ